MRAGEGEKEVSFAEATRAIEEALTIWMRGGDDAIACAKLELANNLLRELGLKLDSAIVTVSPDRSISVSFHGSVPGIALSRHANIAKEN